jgi:hypothetical protein
MKACSVCSEAKALSEYHKDSGAKDGHSTRCKACVRAAGQAWREQNAERKRAHAKAYYEANKARVLEQQRHYYEATKPERTAVAKAWAEANPDKVRAAKQRYAARRGDALKEEKRTRYLQNREAALMKNKAWREANPEKVAEYRRRLVDELGPSYVAGCLGMQTATAPPELLQMKRDEIALRRLARLLKEASNAKQQNG